ncbi:SMC-Scp complex subunit ScpB, partial [Candidatus Woesearchaeota archaeon]
MHDLKKTIRAVLFASAQKLELEKIAKICKTSEEEALKELEDWKKELDKTNDPMKLIQEGNTWRLTIREKFIPAVRKIVKKTEIPKSILETLSVVAYKAPVLQSEVIKIRTNKAYDHLTYLEKTGFLTREKHGRTKMLKLTPKFYEYFDISPEKLKAKMNEKIPLQTFETVEIVDEPKKELQTYTEKLGELEIYEETQETKEEQKKEEVEQKEEK